MDCPPHWLMDWCHAPCHFTTLEVCFDIFELLSNNNCNLYVTNQKEVIKEVPQPLSFCCICVWMYGMYVYIVCTNYVYVHQARFLFTATLTSAAPTSPAAHTSSTSPADAPDLHQVLFLLAPREL